MTDGLKLESQSSPSSELKYSRKETSNTSQCSCIECSEHDCFAKRRLSQLKCTCGECRSTKTCLFYKDFNFNDNESNVASASKNIPDDDAFKKTPVDAKAQKEGRVITFEKIGNKYDYPVLSSFVNNEKKIDPASSKTDAKKESKLISGGIDNTQSDRYVIFGEADKSNADKISINSNKIVETKQEAPSASIIDEKKEGKLIFGGNNNKENKTSKDSNNIVEKKQETTSPTKTNGKKESKLILDAIDRNQNDRPLISCDSDKNQVDNTSIHSNKIVEKQKEILALSQSKVNEIKQDKPLITYKNETEKHDKSAFVSRKTDHKKYGRPILTCNINKNTNNDITSPIFLYDMDEKKPDEAPDLPIGKIHKNSIHNQSKQMDENKIHVCKTDSMKSDRSKKCEGDKINLDSKQSSITHKVKSIVADGTERFEKEIVYEVDQDTTRETITESKYSLVVLPKPDKNSRPKATSVNPSDLETAVHSVSVSYSPTELKPCTHLSAQIMNVPYTNFKNSISTNESIKTRKNLTRYDVMKRIKEAYNACSCKICECITNIVIPQQNQICDCKPCECLECRSYRNDTYPGKTQSQVPNASETFKNNLKKMLSERKSDNCDCNRCGCLECTKFKSKTCDCEPCECTECKYCKSLSLRKPKTYIVATVGEDIQRRVCTCDPCACFQCGNVYGSVARNVTHEMSTGINRHPNCHCDSCFNDDCEQEGVYTCNCDRHKKIIRKPVQADNHDFDIRTAKVSNTRTRTFEAKSKKQKDYIAMYAALTTSYKADEALFNTSCACEICNCLVCECQEKMHKPSQQYYGLLKKVPKSANLILSCDCKPCECTICNKYNPDLLMKVVSTNHSEKNEFKIGCKCEICECIHCKNLDGLHLVSSNYENLQNKIYESPMNRISCDCTPCECIDCQKIPGNYLDRSIDQEDEKIRAKTLKQCNFPVYDRVDPDHYLDKIPVNNENGRSREANGPLHYTRESSRNSAEHMYINYDFPEHSISYIDPNKGEKQGTSYSKERNFANLNTKRSRTVSYDTYLQCQSEKQPTSVQLKNYKKDSNITSSYESAISSCRSLSKGSLRSISCLKDTVKSWDSCNSSGYDCSDYLIKFPRATVKHCIDDVMNLENNLNMSHLKTDVDYKNEISDSLPFPWHCEGEKLKPAIMNHSTSKPFTSGHIYYAKMCSKQGHTKIDYDNCSFRRLRVNRPRCASQSYCWSDFVRKNEATQTLLKLIGFGANNEVKNNIDIYFHSMNEQRVYPHLATSQELVVSKDKSSTLLLPRSLKSSHNDAVQDIPNERYNIKELSRNLPNYMTDKMLDARKVNINYKCINNTIREARAFTLELLRILDKYDKANRNFESIFEKLKKSHESIFNDLFASQNYDSLSVSSKILGAVPEEHQPQKDCDEVIVKAHIKVHKTEDIHCKNSNANEKGDTNTDCKNVDVTQDEISNQTVDVTATEEPKLMKLEQNDSTENSNTFTTLKQFVDKDTNVNIHKERHEKRSYKKYKKMIKRATSVIRKTNLKNEIVNDTMINIGTSSDKSNNISQTDNVEKVKQAIKIKDKFRDGITTAQKEENNEDLETDNNNVGTDNNSPQSTEKIVNKKDEHYAENKTESGNKSDTEVNNENDNQDKSEFNIPSISNILETNKVQSQERNAQNTRDAYCFPKIQESSFNVEEDDQGIDEIFEEALEFNDSYVPTMENTSSSLTILIPNPLDKVNEIIEICDQTRRSSNKTFRLIQDIKKLQIDFFKQADIIQEKVKFKPKLCLSTHAGTTPKAQTRPKMSKEALNLDTTNKHAKISKRSLELQDTDSIHSLTSSVIQNSKKRVNELISNYKQNISKLKEDMSNKQRKLSKRSLEIDENLLSNTCEQTKKELCNKIFELDYIAERNTEDIKYRGYAEKETEPAKHSTKIFEEENTQIFTKIIKQKDTQICDELEKLNTRLQNFMSKVKKRQEEQRIIHRMDREKRHITQPHNFRPDTTSFVKVQELRGSPTRVLQTSNTRRAEDVVGSTVLSKSDSATAPSKKHIPCLKILHRSKTTEINKKTESTPKMLSLKQPLNAESKPSSKRAGVTTVDKHSDVDMLSLKQPLNAESKLSSKRAGVTTVDKHSDVDATLKCLKDFASSPILNQNISKRVCLASASERINKANNTSNVSTSNSICDALKIGFESVRRVSDHTVIVKWNIPSSTKGILGYELLVDGRAVQKILSPTRCLAVVTCLPPVPRVLLTVRTIISGTKGRYPTATIVYHPRV